MLLTIRIIHTMSAELDAAISNLTTAVAQVAPAIQALKDQVAAGQSNTVTPENVQAINDAAAAITAAVAP